MNNIVVVCIFDGIDDVCVCVVMVVDYGIEIGISFGLMVGKVWCIGMMGYNVCCDMVLMMFVVFE